MLRFPLGCCVLSSALLILCPSVQANTYAYSAGSRDLGQGFSRLNPGRAFPSCFDEAKIYTAPYQPPQNRANGASQQMVGAGPFSLRTHLVDSREELYKMMHIDVALSAHYLAASGSLSTSFDHQATFSSHDVTWVVFGEQHFQPLTLLGDSEDALTQDAKSLLNQPKQLNRRCGEEYVKIQERAAMIAAVFTLHSDTNIDKTDIKAHVEGGVTFSGGSVSMTANFQQFISQSRQHGSIDISIYGFGGGGITALGPAMTAADLASFQSALTSYITTQITPGNSEPVSFTTARFDSFAHGSTDETTGGADADVTRIYVAYSTTQPLLDRVQKLIEGRSGDFAYLSDAQIASLQSLRTDLTTTSNAQYDALKKCVANGSCQFPLYDKFISWPTNPEPHCIQWKYVPAQPAQCLACQFTVFIQGLSQGASTPSFSCTHMPQGAKVQQSFDGFAAISDAFPDNKVWNSFVALRLVGPDDPCPDCQGVRSSPGLGAPGVPPNQVKLNFFWKHYQLHGKTTLTGTVSTSNILISGCQTGPTQATCDTAPPAAGPVAPNAQVTKGGFPDDYTQVAATLLIEVEGNQDHIPAMFQ